MNRAIIALIVFYQKYISPYKGFRCAYAALNHGDSCSRAIRKIIEVDGIVGGWKRIKSQFFMCSLAYDTLLEEKNNDEAKKKKRCMDRCDVDPCQALNCIPEKWCKGDGADGGCDLPCDCSL
jgi:putative component of membrane protein insertase Oxa1/YidC/SpoIIIJ protein YidD